MKKNLLFICFIIFCFYGCSFKNRNYTSNTSFPEKSNKKQKLSSNLSYEDIYTALNTQYQDWKGVKYKYGGYSKKGIDCSAFVQKTFKDKLNIKIPRTTILQMKTGFEVNKNDIQIGDLIFFRTNKKVRHVGIYIDKGNFLHASTKRGVTISSLNNPYYIKHFWKIIRVIN